MLSHTFLVSLCTPCVTLPFSPCVSLSPSYPVSLSPSFPVSLSPLCSLCVTLKYVLFDAHQNAMTHTPCVCSLTHSLFPSVLPVSLCPSVPVCHSPLHTLCHSPLRSQCHSLPFVPCVSLSSMFYLMHTKMP